MKMCKYLYIVSRLFAIYALRIINGRMERLESTEVKSTEVTVLSVF